MSTTLATVYITAPSTAEAEKLARTLMERRLIACANIWDGALSIYRWEGEVQAEAEAVMVCKTRMALAQDVIEAVTELHPYDVPCVTVMEIADAQPEYAAWVAAETTV